MGLEIVIGLIVVALVGWAICEFKYKALPFEHAPEEEEGWEEFKEHLEANGNHELNIREIMANNSTNVFDAVDSADSE